MSKDSSASSMSEESIACLSDVKKGKPRKYAMICKGASIVSLVIYKKGNVEKRKKEAKEAGKGQFYFGVVDGQGASIRFVLARNDGFSSEPVKTTVLKDYLQEAADVKCKPYFEIVEQAQLVLDEDDPLVARFLKLQDQLINACDSHPDRAQEINSLSQQIGRHFDQDSSDAAEAGLSQLENLLSKISTSKGESTPSATQPPSSSKTADTPESEPVLNDAAVQFTARLKALKPAIDAAIAMPGANPDIKLRFSEAAVYARKREFEPANRLLDQVQDLLKSSVTSDLAGGQSKVEDDALKFTTRLKQLKPQIDAALALPGASPELKKKFGEAADFARKRDFKSAQPLLDQVAALLQQSKSPADPQAGDAGAQFLARLKQLKPRIDAVLAVPGVNPDIKLRFSEAAVFARKKEFGPANQLLDQVETLLDDASSSAPAADGSSADTGLSLVKLGTARIQWDAVRSQSLKQINRLKLILTSIYGDSTAEQSAYASAISQLDSAISALNQELGDKLDAVLNAESQRRPQLLPAAREVLGRFIKFVETDQLMKLLDGNEYAPDMLVTQPLRAQLQEIAKAIR